MKEYYFEYAQPKQSNYDVENPNPTNFDKYEVKYNRVVIAPTIHAVNSVIKDELRDAYPEYINYDYGVVLFTEFDSINESPPITLSQNESKFSDKDWTERLERAVTSPDNIVHINLD